MHVNTCKKCYGYKGEESETAYKGMTHKCVHCSKEFSSAQRLKSHYGRKKTCETKGRDEGGPTREAREVNEENRRIVRVSERVADMDEKEEIMEEWRRISGEEEVEEIVVGEEGLKCVKCGATFKTRYNINSHLYACHKEEQRALRECARRTIRGLARMLEKLQRTLEERERDIKELNGIIRQDNINKTSIISQQSTVQEKTIDYIRYLKENCKENPVITYPDKIELSQGQLENMVAVGAVGSGVNLLKSLYLEGKEPENLSVYCVDVSRQKFVLRHDEGWVVDAGGKTLMSKTLTPLVDALLRKHASDAFEASFLPAAERDIGMIVNVADLTTNLGNEKHQKAIITHASKEFDVKRFVKR